jgi:hypothetical protein
VIDLCSPEVFAVAGTAVFFVALILGGILWDRTKLSRLLPVVLSLLFPLVYSLLDCPHAAGFLSVQGMTVALLLGLLVNVIIWFSGLGRKRA